MDALKCVMIGERIHDRAEHSDMMVFDEMTRGYGNDENREKRMDVFWEKL